MISKRLFPWFFSCLVLCALLGVSISACENAGWWGPVSDPSQCDPSSQPILKEHPLWKDTFGSQSLTADACLRISWGTQKNEGRGLLVRINPKGQMTASPVSSTGNNDTSTTTPALSLEVPPEAQKKPRSFRLFVFGVQYQLSTRTQPALCQETMANPAYDCLKQSENECWFSLAFRPTPPSSSIQVPPIPDAPSASCKFFLHAPPEELTPTENPTPDENPSATEPPEKPEERPIPEPSPEPPADRQTPEPPPDAGPEPPPDQTTPPEPRPEPTPDGSTCPKGCVQTLSGNGQMGRTDGAGANATFQFPRSIVLDSKGNLFVADTNNHSIRKVDPQGVVVTFAGNGTPGFANGVGILAQFKFPRGIAIDQNDNLYVADSDNHRIRQIDPQANVTTVAGNGISGHRDGPASTAEFQLPRDVAIDKNGNIYVSDQDNYCIRKISNGTVSTFAGLNGNFGSVDGTGSTARFNDPKGLAVDANDNLYVADSSNNIIRHIDPSGKVTTIAGEGTRSFADGPALQAQFHFPTDLAWGPNDKLYIVDTNNTRVRVYDPVAKVVSTIAGTRTQGFLDGPALQAQFDFPRGIAVGPTGNIYVADTDNHRIRLLIP